MQNMYLLCVTIPFLFNKQWLQQIKRQLVQLRPQRYSIFRKKFSAFPEIKTVFRKICLTVIGAKPTTPKNTKNPQWDIPIPMRAYHVSIPENTSPIRVSSLLQKFMELLFEPISIMKNTIYETIFSAI